MDWQAHARSGRVHGLLRLRRGDCGRLGRRAQRLGEAAVGVEAYEQLAPAVVGTLDDPEGQVVEQLVGQHHLRRCLHVVQRCDRADAGIVGVIGAQPRRGLHRPPAQPAGRVGPGGALCARLCGPGPGGGVVRGGDRRTGQAGGPGAELHDVEAALERTLSETARRCRRRPGSVDSRADPQGVAGTACRRGGSVVAGSVGTTTGSVGGRNGLPVFERARQHHAEQRPQLGRRDEVAAATGPPGDAVEAVVGVIQRGVDELRDGDGALRADAGCEPLGERGCGGRPLSRHRPAG